MRPRGKVSYKLEVGEDYRVSGHWGGGITEGYLRQCR
jgi:hypothetical protein